MININWQSFKTKFYGTESKSFENLAYQLFCFEHKITVGIFRFKNQTGIETEPINDGDDTIGFQAKYYETKLSENKDDILDSIKKAKNKNQKISKILIYLNQEFAESSKKNEKDPKFKTEIEDSAKELDVSIEWRVPSHFERQLALQENSFLAEYFFTLGKNAIDFLSELKNHTENILFPIQDEIEYNSQKIKIDRQEKVNELRGKDNSQIIIISGDGGCGKTAIIKELYKKLNSEIAIYVFKAAEFNVTDINSFLSVYGAYSLMDFIEMHKNEEEKILIIDSAEKLADFQNQDIFIELLSALLKNSWKIYFTTRNSYLNDLKYSFIEIYKLKFQSIQIDNISLANLQELSNEFNFQIPDDSRLKNLICNLFYLNEYLQNYESVDIKINYKKFKQILWQKKILSSNDRRNNIHINRETSFLAIVKARCETGLFFVKPIHHSDEALSKLEKDEIIKYDTNNGGYFITHDIYEEWALERIIERDFLASPNFIQFFTTLGTSLPIRRAFRAWLSEKLAENIEDIKAFIENAFVENQIEQFWKDELLVSVLLSDYSAAFFSQFENTILANNESILNRIIFLLRIACKEVDDSTVQLLGNNNDFLYAFTKPKGHGWEAAINLIYKNIKRFTPSNISTVIPMLLEWVSNNRKGETTRQATLFSIYFYELIIANPKSRYKLDKNILKVIIEGSHEVKTEIKKIIDDVIKHKSNNGQEIHSELCDEILNSEFNNLALLSAIPEYVIKLADSLWFKENKKENSRYSSYGVEQYYSIEDDVHHDYHPASAYQTPIYWLLIFSFEQTIDFIIDFTNKTVQSYVDSGFDKDIQEVKINIEGTEINQYISNSLWNMYRGTGSPVTPYLLQSMHMALEKYLLGKAKSTDADIISSWLKYLIINSKSASITAVVTSVVLAEKDKFFDIAAILFKTREFFSYDNMRLASESSAKSLYSIGYGLNNRTKSFDDERIKTCDDPHRQFSLEHIALQYQFFRTEPITEEEVEKRQNVIWSIIDGYYSEVAGKSKEGDSDKNLKLMLARIDRRKMNPTIERHENGISISFNPEIEQELKEHSEEALRQYNQSMKYISLKMWGMFKFDGNYRNADYDTYEHDPKRVLSETKEIIEILNKKESEEFHLFNSRTPAYTCAALIKEYESQLSLEEKDFCKEIILSYAMSVLHPAYDYQISDGTEVAINAIPFLYKIFPEEKTDFNTLLTLILFDYTPIGQYKRICDYVIESLNKSLWEISFNDAHSILVSFIKFKPLFDEFIKENKNKSYFLNIHERKELLNTFFENQKTNFENSTKGNIRLLDTEYSSLTLENAEIGFQLIPTNTINDEHLTFVSAILSIFPKLLVHDNDIDYSLRHRFFKKYSYFIINREKESVNKFIQPIIDNFTCSKEVASLLQELISAEDNLNHYEQFWIIWQNLYPKFISLFSGSRTSYSLNEITHNYLLAWPYWKDTAKSWRSLKDREKTFFHTITKDLGYHPFILDSISKFLNEIGEMFLNDGIYWISEIISKNPNLANEELGINTVYYIEKTTRKYIYHNRTKIRTTINSKNSILTILNFLVNKGSVKAYMLREDIV